ncbi:MAG TPA: outer membrane beta-barrel domain-containing protein [Gammaproteobacteria bacterium]|jgi:outer membrane beta-barrel protein|nr:outer membrane beta-barrel domain-containing protein [Gammaproteobacteria bacterium]
MEGRSVVLLLTLTLAVGVLSGCGRDRLVRSDDNGQPPVIEPDVERREIKVPKIKKSDFEVGVFAGSLSIEDFGVHNATGATFAYHVTDKVFVQLGAGRTTAGLTSFERLSGAAQLLTDAERDYTYYNVSVGYDILPGEGFFGKKRAWNTATYLIGGVGKTKFAGDDRFTMNIGLGYRIMPLDWLAVHADVEDQIFDTDLLGQAKTSHNLGAHLGVTFFF